MNAEVQVSPPHAIEAEQAVIGLCLTRPAIAAEFVSMLTADMFYDELHADIYQCIIDRWRSNEPFTPEFVMIDMRGDARWAHIPAGVRYIQALRSEMMVMGPTWRPDAQALAGVIIEAAAKRALMTVLDESRWDLEMNPAMTAQDAIDRLAAQNQSAMDGFASAMRREKGIKESFIEYLYAAEAPFVSSGLSSLDAVIGGFRRGNSVIIGGRPSMGKSALALFSAYMAARRGEPTVYYSYEMTIDELTGRTISLMLSRQGLTVDYSLIMGKRADLREIEQVKLALDHLEQLPLIFVDASGMTIESLRADILRQKTKLALTKRRLSLAVVDYLQLIAPTPGIKERIQQVGHFSRGLKAIAKHADLPVVTLSQLNRANEQRQDKMPQLSDLRESGDIEQDADTVIFVHREAYYTEREMKKAQGAEALALEAKLASQQSEADALVAKNRHGPVRLVTMGADMRVNRFYDLDNQGAAQ